MQMKGVERDVQMISNKGHIIYKLDGVGPFDNRPSTD